MTHKQQMMPLPRVWPQTDTRRSHLRQIVANLKRLVEVPTGYQDENGFHYGHEPERRDIQWPPK